MKDRQLSRRQAIGRLGALGAAGAAGMLGARPGAAAPVVEPPRGPWFNARDLGAVGDGHVKNTQALQKALDAAAAAGGGAVFVPNGRYLTGQLQMRDNVTLHLAEGCTILGSKESADYPDNALIHGKGVRNIALTGRGSFVGQGEQFVIANEAPGRPKLVKFIECRDVLIADLWCQDSASWGIHFDRCERAVVRGIRLFSHANYNNDGIDIDSCRDVAVAQCMFDCQDDAICLKSHDEQVCENVMISDCVVSSHCNAIKMGTGSLGGFKNITITNCTVVAPRYSKLLNGQQRGIGGINLEIVDGGAMDRVTISNIAIEGVSLPLFIRLGDRGRKRGRPTGTLMNVIISNIVATKMGQVGSSITGQPGHRIENVTLSDLSFSYEGGGTPEDATREVKERPDAYPEGTMFGKLPAYGLYCRHAKGLKLRNVRLALEGADARHAVIFDDVEELDVDGLECQYSPKAAAQVRMIQTRQALLRGCRPSVPEGTFLHVEGKDSTGIALLANDLRRAGRAVETAPEVAPGAVMLAANLGAVEIGK